MKVVVLKNYETGNIALLAVNEEDDVHRLTMHNPKYEGYSFVKQLHGLEFDGLYPQTILESDRI